MHDGVIGRIRDGDRIRIDAAAGTLEVAVDGIDSRPLLELSESNAQVGLGRELFNTFRSRTSGAEQGGGIFEDIGA